MSARGSLLAALLVQLWALTAFAAAPSWDQFAHEFLEQTFAENPSLAVYEGRHEYDGRVADFSRNAIRKHIDRLHAARQRAAEFRDDALTPEQRFERDYVLAVVDRDLFSLETLRWPFRSPGFYFWLDPQVYISRDYAPLAQRLRAYVNYAKAVPRAVDQMRANLQGPLPRSYIRLGHILAGGLASLYEKDVPQIFASVDDRALQAEFQRANASAIAAMKALDAWFTRAERTATDDFALGPDMFAGLLRAGERIDVPIAHLKDIGERDLERNLANLKQACEALAPSQSLDSCVRDVLAQRAPDDVIQVAKDQLGGLRAFVADHHLVTIPSADVVKVEETPPHQRWSSASISIPGPFDTKVASIYYITPPDPKWSKEERDAYIPGKYVLPFISAHEVWPGHFLQFLHARQTKSTIGRVFTSYAFSEGWAHYCEEMMWDAGVAGTDPAAHVGQIAEALLRDVRLLAAIGMHTGGMTVEQAATMFREKAFQDVASARKEADRGTFDPGYGAYTLGKLTILKLREDWTASRGGREAWQAFHDQLLSYGSPPLPLVRKAMLGPNAGPSL